MLGCRVQSSEMLGCSTPRFVRRISCDSCRVRAPDARDAVIHALIVRARFDLVFHAPLALPRGCRCSLLRRVEPRGSHCRPQGGDCVWPDTTSVARPTTRSTTSSCSLGSLPRRCVLARRDDARHPIALLAGVDARGSAASALAARGRSPPAACAQGASASRRIEVPRGPTVLRLGLTACAWH